LVTNGLTSSGTITYTGGGFNTNSLTCSWVAFAISSASAKTLTLGSSAITISGAFNNTATVLTVTANTATMTFTGAGLPFNPVAYNYNGLSIVINNTGTVSWGGTGSNATFANFTYAPSTPGTTNSLQIRGNPTITSTFTVTGAAAPNRVMIQSDTAGTARTITATSVSTNGLIDFQDITGAGAATWSNSGWGDALGNSGITFATPQTNYRVGAGGNWSSASNWASSSGGTGGTGRVPLPQDTAMIDSHASGTILTETPILAANVDWTGFTGVWGQSALLMVLGNWTTNGTMTSSGSGGLTFAGRSSQTITTGGFNINFGTNRTVAFNSLTGTYTLQDSFNHSNGPTTFTSGTFNANGFNFSTSYVGGVAAVVTLNMGSGTWSLTGVAAGSTTPWTATAGATINASTSTILLSLTSLTAKVFAGGSHTYGTLQVVSNPGSLTISGSNTFSNIISPSMSSIIFTSGTTQTISSATGWQVNGQNNGYEYLPGVAGNYVSTPNAAALDITSDIDLRARMSFDTLSTSTFTGIIGKWNSSNLSYTLGIASAGKLYLALSANGTTQGNAQSSVALPITTNQVVWVRATWVQSSGVVTFYTASGSILNPVAGDWTQLGITGSTVIASIFNGTAVFEIGSIFAGTATLTPGKFYRIQVYNGVAGTLAFDADFTTKTFGANTFTESSTNAATVTINGSGAQLGDGRLSIAATTPGSAATISVASGVVSSDYLILQDSTATGGATFYAGADSTNVSGNTGWTFSNAPTTTSTSSSTSTTTSLSTSSTSSSISTSSTSSSTSFSTSSTSSSFSTSSTSSSTSLSTSSTSSSTSFSTSSTSHSTSTSFSTSSTSSSTSFSTSTSTSTSSSTSNSTSTSISTSSTSSSISTSSTSQSTSTTLIDLGFIPRVTSNWRLS
jgi:hypothetical protein